MPRVYAVWSAALRTFEDLTHTLEMASKRRQNQASRSSRHHHAPRIELAETSSGSFPAVDFNHVNQDRCESAVSSISRESVFLLLSLFKTEPDKRPEFGKVIF